MYSLTAIKEGFHFFRRALTVRRRGFHEYDGDDIKICTQIIEDCWDGTKGYLKTSTGNMRAFYARDFSWAIKHLLKLGQRKRVNSTLSYAFACFKKHGRIRVAINPAGKPFDFPDYSIDSLPSMVHSLRALNDQTLTAMYKEFIETEAEYLYAAAIDSGTGLVRKDKHFSSIKDHALRESSCYDNCMIGMLSTDLDILGFKNPFKDFDYPLLIHRHFWNKTYFLDDLSGKTAVSSDANIFPFWTGVIRDNKMLNLAFATLQSEKLDKPFPLKYHQKGQGHRMGFANRLAPDYETDSIWTHLGLILVETISKTDKRRVRKYLGQYFEHIVKYKTFVEVFDKNGTPYSSRFYHADEGMIWAAMYLSFVKKL